MAETGEFRRKYREQLEDPLYLGYYYHLYIDKAFLQDYLPCVLPGIMTGMGILQNLKVM